MGKWVKKRGKKRGKKVRGKKIGKRTKSFAGTITVVEPQFETVNDAYENLLGLTLVTDGTCDLLGDFTARFFFTPFQGTEPFDGTCTIEDVAGNTLTAAFFNAGIIFPGEGETDLLVPIEAHIIGGNGIYEGYRGKLKLAGRITPKEGGKFGPTKFDMTGEMEKMPKKVKSKHLKLLGLPKSLPLDGTAEFPNASTALTKLSIREMQQEPDAAIEPESETEPYAGDNDPIEQSPDKEDKVAVSKLEGYGKVDKLGRMNLSLILDSFEVGLPFDGTLMMKMLDNGSNQETGHAIKAQFFRAMMMPTEDGDYHFVIPATIIGGYGGYLEAKGAVLLDGKVSRDRAGNLGIATFDIEGDIITEAIVDQWEQERDHQEQLRGNAR